MVDHKNWSIVHYMAKYGMIRPIYDHIQSLKEKGVDLILEKQNDVWFCDEATLESKIE